MHQQERGTQAHTVSESSPTRVHRLADRASAPGEARRLVRSWLDSHPRADHAVLAVSEVVTNAVRYGDAADGARLTLRLLTTASGFRVEVDQPSVTTIEAPAGFPEPDRIRGRGLSVVAALTDRWGVTYRTEVERSTTVWFEMD